MITEITLLRRMIYLYKYPANKQEFERARMHLNKVHNKYGTIDISIIQQLIK